MAEDGISLAEYEQRVRNVQDILRKRDIDVLVAFGSESEPQNLIYLANYWPAFETSSVVIPREGKPALAIGPETRTFAEDSGVVGKIFQVLEHRESSEPNYPNQKLDTYQDIFGFLLNGRPPKKIAVSGIAFIALPVHEAIVRASRGAEILKADDILIGLRMKKSANELRLLRQSSGIALKAFEAGLKNIKPGMEEVEVSAHIVGEMFRNKAENVAYTPYILSGSRTNQAISRASHKVIAKNEPIQFSFGCKYNGYASSIGRPLCIGRMPKKYRDLVEVGIGAQELVISSLKPGIPAKDVFAKYWEFLAGRGFSNYFLYGPCHGTGIMECEHPFLEANSTYLLEEGMTFQVDIFLGDRELGLRFEDGVVVTGKGAEAFNNDYRKIIEL
jgi:Xaa-Pro aminopeptidase